MSERPSVSVVVPTFQRAGSIERLLQRFAEQAIDPHDFEVIVSIDGSTDGTLERVRALSLPYALHAHWQPNRGRAAACNAGIRAASGELVVLLDDDMEPRPGFLAAHVAAHAGEPRLGVLGAVPVQVLPSSSPAEQYVGARFNAHLQKLAAPGHDLALRDFYSGNFSIRRRVLAEVGGYDESFREYGNEDLELFLRLKRAGVRFRYSAEAAAVQHYTKTFSGLARDHIGKGRTSVQLAMMHPEIASQTRLGSDGGVSPLWRAVRRVLLDLGQFLPATPTAIMQLTEWSERHGARLGPLYYSRVLDYYYWLGVARARQERGVVKPAVGRRESRSQP